MSTQQKPLDVLAQRIRAMRRERGMTQEELAQKTGFDRTYISLVERGKRNISLLNLCRLAEALGVAPAALLEGVRNEP